MSRGEGVSQPWAREPIPDRALAPPRMAHRSALRYYRWLARSWQAEGQAVELGCWLGALTCCLADGLAANPCFARRPPGQRRLHVYDAFVWHDWMDDHVDQHQLSRRRLAHGDSILPLFWRFCWPYEPLLQVERRALSRRPGPFADAPPLTWNDGPVGLLINDFWDDYETTEQVWETFAPSFLPGRTLIVLHQYDNPHAEGLRRFCRDREAELEPLHDPPGCARSFRWHGR